VLAAYLPSTITSAPSGVEVNAIAAIELPGPQANIGAILSFHMIDREVQLTGAPQAAPRLDFDHVAYGGGTLGDGHDIAYFHIFGQFEIQRIVHTIGGGA
jgi:hypothetical protein